MLTFTQQQQQQQQQSSSVYHQNHHNHRSLVGIGGGTAVVAPIITTTTKSSPPSSIIVDLKPTMLSNNFQPRDIDILCGRGRGVWDHPGNRQFKLYIEQYSTKYSNARNKIDKGVVVASLVDIIREHGVLFLKQDTKTKCWYDIGEYQARDKTGHAIRDYISKNNTSNTTTTTNDNDKKDTNGKKQNSITATKKKMTMTTTTTKQRKQKKQQQKEEGKKVNNQQSTFIGSNHPVFSSLSSPNKLFQTMSSFDEEISKLDFPIKDTTTTTSTTTTTTTTSTFPEETTTAFIMEEGSSKSNLRWSELFPIDAFL